MIADVPVINLGASAVGETVGDAALVLGVPDPCYVAAIVHWVCPDYLLRARLKADGWRRVFGLTGESAAARIVEGADR
jgi:hypothetical protein